MAQLHPKITSNLGITNGDALMSGDYSSNVALSFADGQDNGWVQFEFAQPFKTQALTLASEPAGRVPWPWNSNWRG